MKRLTIITFFALTLQAKEKSADLCPEITDPKVYQATLELAADVFRKESSSPYKPLQALKSRRYIKILAGHACYNDLADRFFGRSPVTGE